MAVLFDSYVTNTIYCFIASVSSYITQQRSTMPRQLLDKMCVCVYVPESVIFNGVQQTIFFNTVYVQHEPISCEFKYLFFLI